MNQNGSLALLLALIVSIFATQNARAGLPEDFVVFQREFEEQVLTDEGSDDLRLVFARFAPGGSTQLLTPLYETLKQIPGIFKSQVIDLRGEGPRPVQVDRVLSELMKLQHTLRPPLCARYRFNPLFCMEQTRHLASRALMGRGSALLLVVEIQDSVPGREGFLFIQSDRDRMDYLRVHFKVY